MHGDRMDNDLGRRMAADLAEIERVAADTAGTPA